MTPIALGALLLFACGGGGAGGGDADADSDSDSDTDSDTDSDGDPCCEDDPAPAGWTRERVAGARGVAGNPRVGGTSAVMDASGSIHAAWGDGTTADGQILYSTGGGASASWAAATIANESVGLDSTAIALSDGEPHVAWSAHVAREGSGVVDVFLRIAAGPGWGTDTIASAGSPHGPGLGIGADGVAHVSFYLGGAGASRATDETGEWITGAVAEGDGSGDQRTALAIDPDGAVHVAMRGLAGEIVHAVFEGDVWATEVVDDSGSAGGNPATAFDADGAVHLVYESSEGAATDGEVRWGTNASGAWRTETVAVGREVGAHCAIAVGPDSAVHLAWDDPLEVRYAARTAEGWAVETIARIAGDPAIVVDDAGVPIVLYQDRCRMQTRAARRSPGDGGCD